MKRIYLSVLILFIVITFVQGQSIDYNKIILPDNAKDITIEERLVQIAWRNNPKTAVAANNVDVGRYELRRVQWSWLDHFRMQGNLNEFTIKGRDETDPNARVNFYPRYNFSVNFSLGDFVTIPLNTKIARKGYETDQENIKALKLQIRGDVLRRYQHFKTSKELFDIQRESYENLVANFKLVEKKFNNGEITLNEYNNVKDRYDNQLIRKITSEGTYQQAKLDLEELLGLKMEEIL